MSIEHFKEFSQRVAEDEAIRQKVQDIGLLNVDRLIAYGQELGLPFTPDDMVAAAKEKGFDTEELTEEQLEKIAGGFGTITLVGVGIAALACVFIALTAQYKN